MDSIGITGIWKMIYIPITIASSWSEIGYLISFVIITSYIIEKIFGPNMKIKAYLKWIGNGIIGSRSSGPCWSIGILGNIFPNLGSYCASGIFTVTRLSKWSTITYSVFGGSPSGGDTAIIATSEFDSICIETGYSFLWATIIGEYIGEYIGEIIRIFFGSWRGGICDGWESRRSCKSYSKRGLRSIWLTTYHFLFRIKSLNKTPFSTIIENVFKILCKESVSRISIVTCYCVLASTSVLISPQINVPSALIPCTYLSVQQPPETLILSKVAFNFPPSTHTEGFEGQVKLVAKATKLPTLMKHILTRNIRILEDGFHKRVFIKLRERS